MADGMALDLDALWGLAIALLGGLAVGIEREWSGKASGPEARFAGLRTFTLLGLASGIAGWLWTSGLAGPANILLAGLCGLVIVAYFVASRTDVGGTTEVAAFIVIAAGLLAGAGSLQLSSGIIAITAFLLFEKNRLHALISKVGQQELRAGVRFVVMAAVILPLLPNESYGPYGGIQPRLLWALVLFFSGLSFVGYVAQRVAGPERGYAITGLLGGVLSSTSVTLTFSRLNRSNAAPEQALAAGVVGANVMVFPRVLIAAAVLEPSVAWHLWPAFLLPTAIGVVLAIRHFRDTTHAERALEQSPLQFWSALQLAAIFQGVLFAVSWADQQFGQSGIYASATVLGLVNMDAVTISMARLTGDNAAATGAMGIALGLVANTVTKIALAVGIGRGAYRWRVAVALVLMGGALAAWVIWKFSEAA